MSFGRVMFYWIETNHLANETVRWAVVDRNPDPSACPDPDKPRSSRMRGHRAEQLEFDDATVCIGKPDADGNPASVDPTMGGPVDR